MIFITRLNHLEVGEKLFGLNKEAMDMVQKWLRGQSKIILFRRNNVYIILIIRNCNSKNIV